MRIKSRMKRVMPYVLRAVLYLAIAFIVMPAIILRLAQSKPAAAGIPLLVPFCIAAGTLLILGLRKLSIPPQKMLTSVVCGCISVAYYLLLMKVTYDAALLHVVYPGLFLFVQTTLYALALVFLFCSVFPWQFLRDHGRSVIVALCISVPMTIAGFALVSFAPVLKEYLAKLIATLLSATLVTDPVRGTLLQTGAITAQFGAADTGVYQLIVFGILAVTLAIIERKQAWWKGVLGLVGVAVVHVAQLALALLLTRHDPSLAAIALHPNMSWLVFALYTLAWYKVR